MGTEGVSVVDGFSADTVVTSSVEDNVDVVSIVVGNRVVLASVVMGSSVLSLKICSVVNSGCPTVVSSVTKVVSNGVTDWRVVDGLSVGIGVVTNSSVT